MKLYKFKDQYSKVLRCCNTVQSFYIIPGYNRFAYNTVMLWLPNIFTIEFYKGIIGKRP